MNTSRKIFLARFLTRSGDQAWDFAVPMVLLTLFPGQVQVAATYYLLVRIGHVAIMPRLAQIIDQSPRIFAIRAGILLQVFGVLIGAASIFSLSVHQLLMFSPQFLFLVAGGLVSGLGSSLTDISVAGDLIPSLFKETELPAINSRIRQIDLLTEVTSPVVAGLILHSFSTTGFYIIALWNVISFIPEYLLLSGVLKSLRQLKINAPILLRASLIDKLIGGWASFFRQPVAVPVIAYSILWLSVLSPHGVLLTAFLKDGWRLHEWTIGTFRGLGALFGLVATWLFPMVISRWGLKRGAGLFLWFQAVMVCLALAAFFQGGYWAQISFLIFVLFSRVGLYGFSLSEVQIRQMGIPVNLRGEVNGVASALTALATIGLYGAGAALPGTEDFPILIMSSVGFVLVAALLYTSWAFRQRALTGGYESPSPR